MDNDEPTYRNMEEMQRDTLALLQEGLIKGAVVNGQVRFFHITHVPQHPYLKWLSIHEIAVLNQWDWFFRQN